MADDTFLKINGIDGESTDDKHMGWIEVLSYSWGVSQSESRASISATGGAAGGRADFQDLSIVKALDKSSPKLYLACAKGDHLQDVTLELCRAAGNKEKYMEFKLTNVIVSSASLGGGGGGEPTESITFNFGKIEATYTQIARDGQTKGHVPMNWDLAKNKGG
jgi:type VI secretion system secreted protein Hcp